MNYGIVWFAGRTIAQATPAGPASYTFADHLGTPIIQTDTTGTITWRVDYEPFGNVYEMREGSRTGQPLRFPSRATRIRCTFKMPIRSWPAFGSATRMKQTTTRFAQSSTRSLQRMDMCSSMSRR